MTAAHGALAPPHLLRAWTLDPVILAVLAVVAVAYAAGARRIRGRGLVGARQLGSFAAGMATLVLALASPLAALSSALFAAHMVQHLLLMVVAAPLLVCGRPGIPVMLALPVRTRRAVRRATSTPSIRAVSAWASHPVVVWLLAAVVLWAWHLPSLYQLALANDGVHAAEHASFLLTAALLWWLVVTRHRPRALVRPAAVLLVFATALQSSALGAVLTFASAPLYPIHAAAAAAWGLAPLQDQQLAGVIMWIPPGLVYLVVMVMLLVRWFAELDSR
ncbi:MAG: cytochrome c oxidase assembly protein, partial [Actinomycetota bacterium]|nr:cytochrome c oxidase assembly protein [Actinomycetota bacterium]